MKTVTITNADFENLKATPEIWMKAKAYSPTGESLQRAYVFGYKERAFADGMSFQERQACHAGAHAGWQDMVKAF